MSTIAPGPASGTIRSVVYDPGDSARVGGSPLVVFLHGRGEARAAHPDPLLAATVHGPLWRHRRRGWNPRGFVLCPQLATQLDRWHQAVALASVTAIVGNLLEVHAGRIDRGRISLTGFSIGGAGCYAIAAHWQATSLLAPPRVILPVNAYDPEPPWLTALVVPARQRANEVYASTSHGKTARSCYDRDDIYAWLEQ